MGTGLCLKMRGGGLILVKLTGSGRYGRDNFISLAPERAVRSDRRDLMNSAAKNVISVLSVPPGTVCKCSPFKGHSSRNVPHE